MHADLRSVSLAMVLAACVPLAQAEGFVLSSPGIQPGSTLTDSQVFNSFGCTGKNISPALKWSGAPKDTRSFAVTVHDPDAPGGWWHWVVYNIPATTTELPEGAGTVEGKGLPAGSAQWQSDFGSPGFGGACPPPGDKPHRYVFTVHALKTDKLDVPADATAARAGAAIHADELASASFTARYGRSR